MPAGVSVDEDNHFARAVNDPHIEPADNPTKQRAPRKRIA